MTDYDPDALYIVEAVRDHKGTSPFRQFFIKWEDWDESTNTWEPEINLLYNEVAQTYCKEKGLPPIADTAVEKEKKKQERAEKIAQRIKKEEEEERLRKDKKRRRKEAERRRLEEEFAGRQNLPAPPPAPQDRTSRPDSPEIPLDLTRQGRAAVTSPPATSKTTPSPAPLILKLKLPRPRAISVSSDSSIEFLGSSKSSKSGWTSPSTSKASFSSPEQHKTEVWNRNSEDEDSEEEDGQGSLFSVRKVLDMKGDAPNREFFVQWEGYESEDDTWEPESGVGHLDVVRAFIVRKQAEKDAKRKADKKRKRQISEEKEKETKKGEKKSSGKLTASTSSSSSIKKPVKTSSDKFTALLHQEGKKVKASDFKIPKAKTETKTSDEYKALWRKQLGLKEPEPVSTATKELHPILSRPMSAPATTIPKPQVKLPPPSPLVPVPVFKARESPAMPLRELRIPTPVVEEKYTENVPDDEIRRAFPNEHFNMVKMVCGRKVHESVAKADAIRTALSEELVAVCRPPPEDRFVGLYNRLKWLRENANFYSGQVEPPPVTTTDHMFERAMPDLVQRDWTRGIRVPEVIGNYMDYWKSKLLPAHYNAMTWTKPDTILRYIPREVPAHMHNGLKDADVMLHMGRDVMNYVKEKNRQRCSKQVVRPGRLRGPRRPSSLRH